MGQGNGPPLERFQGGMRGVLSEHLHSAARTEVLQRALRRGRVGKETRIRSGENLLVGRRSRLRFGASGSVQASGLHRLSDSPDHCHV